MKGRVYDPLAGRFTTADPIMQAPFWSQGLNRYAYVFNDPVNSVDPSGFQVDAAGSGAGILMGGLMAGGLGSVAYQAFGPLGLIAGGIGGLNAAFGGGFASGGSGQVTVATGSAAPTTRPTGVNSVNDNKPIAAPVQEQFGDLKGAPVEKHASAPTPSRSLAKESPWTWIFRALGLARHVPPPKLHHGTTPAPAGGARPQAPPPPPSLRIVDQVDDVVELAGSAGGHPIRVMANMSREGGTIYLRQAHIQGPGPGQVGVKGLFDAAREFGRSQGASKVVIEGAKRTTGAGAQKGAVPRVWEITVK
jgi:hypothetical protein